MGPGSGAICRHGHRPGGIAVSATFDCDGCGEETPTDKRYRYLRPNQPDDAGEPVTDELCPRCSTGKDSSRLFRADADLTGGGGGA